MTKFFSIPPINQLNDNQRKIGKAVLVSEFFKETAANTSKNNDSIVIIHKGTHACTNNRIKKNM